MSKTVPLELLEEFDRCLRRVVVTIHPKYACLLLYSLPIWEGIESQVMARFLSFAQKYVKCNAGDQLAVPLVPTRTDNSGMAPSGSVRSRLGRERR